MFFISKVKELAILNKDTSLLITTPTEIVINNNNNGLIIFDHNLNKESEIPFLQEVLIYSVFKKNSHDELLLYCPDNRCLVHVNLKLGTSSIIKLDHTFDKITFSPVYVWTENSVLLSGYNEDFYQVSLEKGVIKKQDKSDIIVSQNTFYLFYQQVLARRAETIDSSHYQYIYIDEINKKTMFVDFLHGKEVAISHQLQTTHDYLYEKGIFAFVSENEILFASKNANSVSLKTSGTYIFLRAYFLDEDKFVTLSHNKSEPKENKLTLYSITNQNYSE